MDAKQVAHILREIGEILAIKGENPFKTRAYENGARAVEGLGPALDDAVRDATLTDIDGIGDALATKITELVTTGALKYYDEQRASIPAGLLDMRRIPGMGPKKIRAVYDKLGIATIGELEYACKENRLAVLDGFGAKTQQNILAGIEQLKRHAERHLYSTARAEAERLVAMLESLGPRVVKRLSIAGSLRRRRETIRDIDIVASSVQPTKLMDAFTSLDGVESIIAHGDTKSSVRLAAGFNCDLRVVPDEQFPFALLYLTGSKEHNIALRTRAKAKVYKINEYGLFRGERSVKCADEAAIFAKLDLAYIPPELREDMGEIEAAEKDALPTLIEESGVRGILHVHTNASDGVSTLDQLAKAAQALGVEYLGIADHSQSAQYANGLSPERVDEQHAAIDALNKKLKGLRILKGIEVDILGDGTLDYPDKVLKTFDFVIAAVHSRFTMGKADMTKRIVAALRNPHVAILAHPTGRLLLSREPYEVDIDAVIVEAAKLGVALEINANPHRLDLDWRLCKHAKEQGCTFAICPDAHRAEDLGDFAYGVGIARKGWLEPADVVNTRACSEALALMDRRKKG
ncbi:MAG: DNA polymerase/3'-5' exonuclease PolX [Verrucomicrobia bacterium]|nr:DNA polymerase/3'-5' exonuclease PolX [Verrucomicrobiota bacterium]